MAQFTKMLSAQNLKPTSVSVLSGWVWEMLPLGLLYNGEGESWGQRQYLSAFPDEVYIKQCDRCPTPTTQLIKRGTWLFFLYVEH